LFGGDDSDTLTRYRGKRIQRRQPRLGSLGRAGKRGKQRLGGDDNKGREKGGEERTRQKGNGTIRKRDHELGRDMRYGTIGDPKERKRKKPKSLKKEKNYQDLGTGSPVRTGGEGD